MAFESLLRVWNDERVLCNDDDLLVIDKPSGLAVHGGDEALADDVVSRLGVWLDARGQANYLGVHQRLDKQTSGVLPFTRRAELNRALAQEIAAHRARRVYVAAVTLTPRWRLPDHGVLEHILRPSKGERTRVVERDGQRAVTSYRIALRNAERALLELEPKTGRTHQLRVQLAEVGAPVAGDMLYGGAAAPRLMLHARELELKGLGRRFSAEVPDDFEAWLLARDPELGSAARVERALRDAGCRRYPLLGRTTAFRLVNDLGDALPGVTVDCYGDFAVLAVSSEEAFERREELAQKLALLGARGVYLKARVRADLRRVELPLVAPSEPLAGLAAPDEIVVTEGQIRFAVRLADGLSSGLFVDQRDARARISALAREKRVLNLFAYTCSFSVAAALGGASSTLSIDLSRRALSRGRRNFELNNVAGSHRFLKEDVLAWLERARRRAERFDLVVLDPPSFASIGKGATFAVAKDYAKLAEAVFALLAPGGMLLAITNHKKTSQQDLRRTLHEASRGAQRSLRQLKDLPSPLDCPRAPSGPWPSKSVLLTVD